MIFKMFVILSCICEELCGDIVNFLPLFESVCLVGITLENLEKETLFAWIFQFKLHGRKTRPKMLQLISMLLKNDLQ